MENERKNLCGCGHDEKTAAELNSYRRSTRDGELNAAPGFGHERTHIETMAHPEALEDLAELHRSESSSGN
jgi:hypothetical protein